MSQTNAIILRFRAEEAERFEALFRAEVYPLWEEFKAPGKFIAASLTPALDGSEVKVGVRDYILHVEVPSMAEHEAFDTDSRFRTFLAKVKPWQPESPKVWLGETLVQV